MSKSADTPGKDPKEGTPNRRRIYLLRHGDVSYYTASGEVVADPDAVSLNAQGRIQAQAIGETLAHVDFDLVMHTGMPRTIETARLANTQRGICLEERAEFREIVPGKIGHLGREVIVRELIYGFERATMPNAQFARGEEFAHFYARISSAMANLAADTWHTAMLVAHSGTNRAILSWVTQGGLASLGTFEQDPGCLNIIDLDIVDGAVQRRYLRVVNYTPLLPTKDGTRHTSLELMFAEKAPSSREPTP